MQSSINRSRIKICTQTPQGFVNLSKPVSIIQAARCSSICTHRICSSLCNAASSLIRISVRTRPLISANSFSIWWTTRSGIVIFSVQTLVFKTKTEYSKTRVDPWGFLSGLPPLQAKSRKLLAILALVVTPSTSVSLRTGAFRSPLARGCPCSLWQMTVGPPFTRGHLYFQASFPWRLLWLWRCLRTPSTGGYSRIGSP